MNDTPEGPRVEIDVNAQHISLSNVQIMECGEDAPPMGIAIGPCIMPEGPRVMIQLIDAHGNIAMTFMDQHEFLWLAQQSAAASVQLATSINMADSATGPVKH